MDLRLEVDGCRPVTGRVLVEGAEPLEFTGWLTLLALLERLVEGEGSDAVADGLGGKLDTGGEP
jgi:hypothetical protein